MARSPSPPPNDQAPCEPFHTQPSDLQLVKTYLRPWVDCGLKTGAFVHVYDVYATDPAIFTRTFAPMVSQDGEIAWYFLSPLRRKNERGKRKVRTVATGEGCWNGEAKSKPVVDVLDGGRDVGYRQSFSFVKKGDDGRRTRTGWLMLELGLESDDQDQDEGSPERPVLCKVYRSPRHPGEPASPTTPTGGERKVGEDDEDDESSATPRPKVKTEDNEGSDASLATGRGRKKSDAEGSTVVAPRNADDEIPDTAAPGRKEKEADDGDTAETSAAAPGTKRKARGDGSSVAASAAEPSRSKNKIDGEVHCPQCGYHFDAEAVLAAAKSKLKAESDTRLVHVEEDSFVKAHTFYQFL